MKTTGIKTLALLLALSGLVLARPPEARALTGEEVLKNVRWGDGVDEVKALLEKQEVDLQLLEIHAPQALATVLLRSGLLETLNRLGFKDTFKPQAQGPKGRRFITFEDKGRTYILLFTGKNHLYQVYVRIPVPVDRSSGGKDNPFKPGRLGLLHGELNRLKELFHIDAVTRDRFGNGFAYSGKDKETKISVLYLPEKEELRLVYYGDSPVLPN